MTTTTVETEDLKVFGSTVEDVTATVNIVKDAEEDICISILTSEHSQEPFVLSAFGIIALSKAITKALLSKNMEGLYSRQMERQFTLQYLKEAVRKTTDTEPKVIPVKAFKLGYDAFPKWFTELLSERKNLVRYYQPVLKVVVKIGDNTKREARFGDYIVKSKEGEIFICTDEEFHANFETSGRSDESK